MESCLSYLRIIVVLRTVLGIFEQQGSVPVVYSAYRKLPVVINMLVGVKGCPLASVGLKAKYKYYQPYHENCRQSQTKNCSSFKLFHPLAPPFTARLACTLVSAAFRNASSAHETIMLVPPLDTKGKVTPVKGRISTQPKTFSMV